MGLAFTGESGILNQNLGCKVCILGSPLASKKGIPVAPGGGLCFFFIHQKGANTPEVWKGVSVVVACCQNLGCKVCILGSPLASKKGIPVAPGCE